MDLRTLARAYDRSADGYDERFRTLQRPKYEEAARLLGGLCAGACLDAGGGTGLYAEFSQNPRVTVLDASPEMLRFARARGLACVLGDLAAPPFAPRSFPLVVSFTAVLEEVPRALRALGALVAPGGALVVSFLAGEAPAALAVERWSGLRLRAGPAPAGQDRLFLLARDP